MTRQEKITQLLDEYRQELLAFTDPEFDAHYALMARVKNWAGEDITIGLEPIRITPRVGNSE